MVNRDYPSLTELDSRDGHMLQTCSTLHEMRPKRLNAFAYSQL